MHTMGDWVSFGEARRAVLLRDAVLVFAGSLLVAVCAKIQIPIPGPIPTTLQTFAVLLVGAALGSRRGTAAIVVYLLEGAAGLPVFALPAAGSGYFLGPTGGYLVGFVAAALLVGTLAERGWDRRFGTAIPAFLGGHAVILVFGALRLIPLFGPSGALTAGVLPFLPGAVLKSFLVAAVLPTAWKLLRNVERPDGFG